MADASEKAALKAYLLTGKTLALAKKNHEKASLLLIECVGSEEEGTKKLTINKHVCTTSGKNNYTVAKDDYEKIDAVEEALNKIDPEIFPELFDFKPEVKTKYLKSLRKLNKKAYKIAAKIITSKPAKKSIKVEKIDKDK